ncbi:MAG: hypothetical protein LUI13_01585 [Lachnospiraceae bacterium]|nr:hypothetical protein [Lachnospiraceae bacterium]
MKKNLLKKLTTVLLTSALLISSVLPASAAASATKIRIKTSVSSMTVGETIELDTKITPSYVDVKDSKIVWSSSNTSVIKILDNYDDEIDIKAVGTGTATITVKISGTNLKATKKITVKKASASSTRYSKYKKKIAAVKSDLKTLYSTLEATAPASARSELVNQIFDFEKQLKKLENRLDTLEDKIESLYYSGKLSAKKYRKLETRLEAAEDYADQVEEYIEYKFGEIDD